MSHTVTFKVLKIRIQKDEYLTSAGRIGETEFWKSTDNQAEVLQFKRAFATCRVEGPFSPVDFELVVSLRAGFVRVHILHKDQGPDAETIAKLLQCIFAVLHHTPGFSPKGALLPTWSRDNSKYMLCKTYASHWFIAALHEVKEEKYMNFSIEDEDMKNILVIPA